jgi:hypothetical protein
LAFDQLIDEDRHAVRKFQRIVVDTWLIHIHLPKSSNTRRPFPATQQRPALRIGDGVVERQFSARHQANRDIRFTSGRKSPGQSVLEFCRHQFVADFGWA